MTHIATINYDVAALAAAFHVSETVALRLGKDGRVMSPWVSSYLNSFSTERPFLLRMLTDTINFARSVNHGAHRDETFELEAWNQWVREHKQVLIADLATFPSVRVWWLSTEELVRRRKWGNRPAFNRQHVLEWVDG